jgi:parvulin-like peptidyl-prolyl isomerase
LQKISKKTRKKTDTKTTETANRPHAPQPKRPVVFDAPRVDTSDERPSSSRVFDSGHLLRKPTLGERFASIFKIKKLIIVFIAITVFIIILLGIFTYKTYSSDTDGKFITKVSLTLNLPALKVNDDALLLADYKNDMASLTMFFENEAANLGANVPTNEEIRTNVINRYIAVLLIHQALEEFNQSVSEDEINTQFEILHSGYADSDELEQIINSLYNWSIDDFIEKAFIPLLEEEKLALILATNPDLNKEKEKEIVSLKNRSNSGESFEELARAYSQDLTAANGGDLEWFSRGQMVQEFEDVAFSLSIGEVSDPFQTSFGWHIVQLTDKDDENDIIRASHILIKNLTVDEFITNKRNNADIKYYIKYEE